MLPNLLFYAVSVHHHRVRTAITDGLSAYNNVGRNVFREGRSGLNHGATSHTCLRIFNDTGTENDIIFDVTVAGYLRSIAENAVVTHDGIVGDMGTFHQEITVSDDRFTAFMRCTIDDYVLSYDVIIADNKLTLLATEVEILRQGSEN